MSILIFLFILYILFCFTLQKIFQKVGVPSNKAWIPGVNFVECCKIVGRPGWNAIYMLFPIYNLFFFTGLCVDIVRSFGKYEFIHTALAVIYSPIIFWQIGNDEKSKYIAPAFKDEGEWMANIQKAHKNNDKGQIHKLESTNPYHKSQVREWVEAVVFAVFAASFIRMFLIEAYVIPTSSMEGSLLTGDFLFVSKAHYGIRTPQTVASIPLLHNRMPYIESESYLDNPKLPYYRLPKFQDIKRMEPVVFNYPEGDSVFVMPNRTFSIHDFRRMSKMPLNPQDLQYINRIIRTKEGMVLRPMDKYDFYIKRCVGISGDSLKIVNRQLFINGSASANPSEMHWEYKVTSTNGKVNHTKLDELGVHIEDAKPEENRFMLSQVQVEKIKALGSDIQVELIPHDKDFVFPHDTTKFKWSMDNFGPLYIPKANASINLTPENMAIYRRLIKVYEGNDLMEKDGKVFINGKESTTYTFKWNYYWMMGDNRHNSEDSRVWGFVPETHVVGKPLFIWFSTKNANIANGIRWSRLFTTANKM